MVKDLYDLVLEINKDASKAGKVFKGRNIGHVIAALFRTSDNLDVHDTAGRFNRLEYPGGRQKYGLTNTWRTIV